MTQQVKTEFKRVYISEALIPKDVRISEVVEESATGREIRYNMLEGMFQTATSQNKNGRSYPIPILERETNSLNKKISASGLIAELNHPIVNPQDPQGVRRAQTIDPERGCAIMRDPLNWDGTNVYGKLRIIRGDYHFGDKLDAMVKTGFIPGISSRSIGGKPTFDRATGSQVVPEDLRMITYDIVESPSVYNARLEAMIAEEIEYMEHIEKHSFKRSLWEGFSTLAQKIS